MAISTIFFDLGDTLVFNTGAGTQQRFDDALDVLQVLQQRGYRIGLLSNQATGVTVAQVAARLAALRLGRYVETALITLSTEIAGNNGKPARPIFDLALSKAGHAAAGAQSIFITEDAAHIAAARGFGWRALLVKRSGGACMLADGECALSLAELLDLLPPQGSLAGTHLDLAPPPKLVDGLWAAPIDISRITANLHFDAASQSASGDATVEFKLGRHAGCPIFDLRQTITGAWLDGAVIPLADVAAHNFGGGVQADMRVVGRVLDTGSAHSLRLTYSLSQPQASTAGAYQPQITWSAGPRLVFNFGFTDLGPGRYLEAFIPANLVYDAFVLTVDLELVGTSVAHTPITNGAITALGINHWRIEFPATSTAFSPLLELRASDSLSSASHNEVLPVSGSTVAVTAWKLVGSGVDVAAQAFAIGASLSSNENSSGRYLHGNRYTAFMHVGGMEYDGATTTSVGARTHEAFHSWWGRGLKPASQNDGWFDEAWTVYHGNGASAVLPLNLADPPVELSSRNSWSRTTPGGSYTAGERLWKGIAALVGAPSLRDHMNAFYTAHAARPATTEQLESHLVSRTGQNLIVDAFHRFVYGFPDPAPLPDVWLRDDVAHPGEEHWPGRFWDSPDLWVRHADDGGLQHQNPEFGQDNWLHARVRNRSASATARHLVVCFNVKNYAGTQFAYPADFLPATTAASAFDLAPGETRIVKACWPRAHVPPVGTHPCLLAAVFSRFDAPVAGKAVWEQNNLAQKNLTVVDLRPNMWFVLPVVIANLRPRLSRVVDIELRRPAKWVTMEAMMLVDKPAPRRGDRDPSMPTADHRRPAGAGNVAATQTDVARREADDRVMVLDCGGVDHGDVVRDTASDPAMADEAVERSLVGKIEIPYPQGKNVSLPATLRPAELQRIGVKFRVPSDAKPGTRFMIDIVQRESRKVVGGVAVAVQVI